MKTAQELYNEGMKALEAMKEAYRNQLNATSDALIADALYDTREHYTVDFTTMPAQLKKEG